MMAKKWKLSDFMEELRQDPHWEAREREREEQRAETARALLEEEKPLVQALAAVGIQVQSVWDLVNEPSSSYGAALEVLLEHLGRDYSAPIRDGIARALAIPQARTAWDQLVASYRAETDEDVKDGLACTISTLAREQEIHDVIALAEDRLNGASRLFLLSTLGRSRDRLAQDALLRLEEDPELKKEIRHMRKRGKR